MKNITYKLFPYLISLLFLFPVLKGNISTFTVILLAINLIIYKITAKDFSFIKPRTLLLTIPFWILLFSSIFSSNFKISVNHIQHSLLFLIIPIVFSLIPNEFFTFQKINLYLKVLKNLCLLIAIIYVVDYLINVPLWKFNFQYQNDSNFRNYIYSYFTLFVIHPTYYTTILVLCSAHSFELVLKQKKYLELIYIAVFLTITFLLLTKLNIVIMVLVLGMMVLFKSSLNLKQRLLVFLFAFSAVTLLVVVTPGIKKRFAEVYQSFNVKPESLAYDSTNVRKAIFDCSTAVIKDNLIFGVGFENLQTQLNDCYKSNYESSFYESHDYMTHNYYFYILASTGLFGFLFYLIYLVNIIRISLKSNLFLFNVFLFNALIICFVEDYFYRQSGILYFNLMFMIFLRYAENKKISNPNGYARRI